MSKLLEEINQNLLVCDICTDRLIRPKTLECLHTFCQRCIENECQQRRYSTASLSCPSCGKRSQIPSGGPRELPDNRLLSSLAEIVSRKPGCDICLALEKRRRPALARCVDCCKRLCRDCHNRHAATRVTQSHTIVELDLDFGCPHHPEEAVNFYCDQCQVCVCIVCVMQVHQQHDVLSLSDGVKRHSEQMQSMVSQANRMVEKARNQLEAIRQCERHIRETEAQIQSECIQMVSSIQGQKKQMLMALHQVYGEETIKLVNQRQSMESDLKSLEAVCSQVKQTEGKLDLLLGLQDMTEKLVSLQEQVSSLQTPPPMKRRPSLIPGQVTLPRLDETPLRVARNGKVLAVASVQTDSQLNIAQVVPVVPEQNSLEVQTDLTMSNLLSTDTQTEHIGFESIDIQTMFESGADQMATPSDSSVQSLVDVSVQAEPLVTDRESATERVYMFNRSVGRDYPASSDSGTWTETVLTRDASTCTPRRNKLNISSIFGNFGKLRISSSVEDLSSIGGHSFSPSEKSNDKFRRFSETTITVDRACSPVSFSPIPVLFRPVIPAPLPFRSTNPPTARPTPSLPSSSSMPTVSAHAQTMLAPSPTTPLMNLDSPAMTNRLRLTRLSGDDSSESASCSSASGDSSPVTLRSDESGDVAAVMAPPRRSVKARRQKHDIRQLLAPLPELVCLSPLGVQVNHHDTVNDK